MIRWPELVANSGFVTGSDRSWWRIRGLLPVQTGVGGEFGVCYRFRLELVANSGFVTGSGWSWCRIRGFRGFSGIFGWGLVVISGFFGTGWPIWLQVRLLFPEIATIPPPKP
ncbi:cytochrome bd ubiquinol oxidase subunit I [Mobiluncus mulieris]|nr:cytochrome bd ubiquinol oxidase subunit I [Mobiluncus mulieris]